MDSHIDYIYVTNHPNTFLRRKLLWKIYVTFWKPTSATFVNCFFISQSQVLLSTCPLEVTGEKYSVFRIQWFFIPAYQSVKPVTMGERIVLILITAVCAIVGLINLLICWDRCSNILEVIFLPLMFVCSIGVLCLLILLAFLAIFSASHDDYY